MGAWDEKNFGNDSAMDWVNEFEENPAIELLIDTLQELVDADDYIDMDIASEGLAAAEIVAALKGKSSTDLPETISLLIEKISFIDGLDTLAIKAVNKAKSENSELMGLWSEGEDGDKWITIQNDLIERLSGSVQESMN